MRRPLSAALLAAALASACVEAPFAHTNPTDAQTNVELALFDVPDSLFSVGDTFTARVEMSPALPAGFPALRWGVSHETVLHVTSTGSFSVMSGAGLLPIAVEVSALVPLVRRGTGGRVISTTIVHWVDTTIVVRQRPVIAQVLCPVGVGCTPFTSIGSPRVYSFVLRDARGFLVRLPSDPYRFGTIVSRDTTIVTVTRSSPSNFIVAARNGGSVWVVLSGEGVSDSTLVQVVL